MRTKIRVHARLTRASGSVTAGLWDNVLKNNVL
jgi:hypothetical protein